MDKICGSPLSLWIAPLVFEFFFQLFQTQKILQNNLCTNAISACSVNNSACTISPAKPCQVNMIDVFLCAESDKPNMTQGEICNPAELQANNFNQSCGMLSDLARFNFFVTATHWVKQVLIELACKVLVRVEDSVTTKVPITIRVRVRDQKPVYVPYTVD